MKWQKGQEPAFLSGSNVKSSGAMHRKSLWTAEQCKVLEEDAHAVGGNLHTHLLNVEGWDSEQLRCLTPSLSCALKKDTL